MSSHQNIRDIRAIRGFSFALMQIVHLHERNTGGIVHPADEIVVVDFVRELSLGTALTFVHYHFGRWLIHFELGVRFLDLRSVFFQLGCEDLYLLLLLRNRCSQILNF